MSVCGRSTPCAYAAPEEVEDDGQAKDGNHRDEALCPCGSTREPCPRAYLTAQQSGSQPRPGSPGSPAHRRPTPRQCSPYDPLTVDRYELEERFDQPVTVNRIGKHAQWTTSPRIRTIQLYLTGTGDPNEQRNGAGDGPDHYRRAIAVISLLPVPRVRSPTRAALAHAACRAFTSVSIWLSPNDATM
jgi:hypothetical protein